MATIFVAIRCSRIFALIDFETKDDLLLPPGLVKWKSAGYGDRQLRVYYDKAVEMFKFFELRKQWIEVGRHQGAPKPDRPPQLQRIALED